MSTEAVLIRYQVEGKRNSFDASGILFDSNFVITTGTILISLLTLPEQKKWLKSFLKSSSPGPKHIDMSSFRVFRELNNNSEINKTLRPLESKVVAVWKCPLVSQSVENLFSDWTLGHINNDESKVQTSDDLEISKELISIFILLKCANEQQDRKKINDIQALSILSSNLVEPERGLEVEVVATPFGTEVFLNSLSRGIICNVVGTEKCLILTDARTVSGCEGGPIFATDKARNEKNKGKLMGMVTCPLTWWRGEWVGLTIGISLMPVLRRLVGSRNVTMDSISSNNNIDDCYTDESTLELIDETVVLIRCDYSWGTGVVLNAATGTIITCSHVIKNDKDVSVYYKEKYYSAKVIFKTRENYAFDLAVIQIPGKFIFKKEIQFDTNFPIIGETVIAAGFPLFSERDDFNLRPSIVSGCIAIANPFMIQTTCCIQSGFSGGALLKDGKLIGIIVSNTRDSTAGAIFPHINFIIPASVFRESIFRYLKTGDAQYLSNLESQSSRVQSLWKMQASKL